VYRSFPVLPHRLDNVTMLVSGHHLSQLPRLNTFRFCVSKLSSVDFKDVGSVIGSNGARGAIYIYLSPSFHTKALISIISFVLSHFSSPSRFLRMMFIWCTCNCVLLNIRTIHSHMTWSIFFSFSWHFSK
jgi:hypothetical protein